MKLKFILLIIIFSLSCKNRNSKEESKNVEVKPIYFPNCTGLIKLPFRSDSLYYKNEKPCFRTIPDSAFFKYLENYLISNRFDSLYNLNSINKIPVNNFYAIGYFNIKEKDYYVLETINQKAENIDFLFVFNDSGIIVNHLLLEWNTFDGWSERVITYFTSSSKFVQKHFKVNLYSDSKKPVYDAVVIKSEYQFNAEKIKLIKEEKYNCVVKIDLNLSTLVELE